MGKMSTGREVVSRLCDGKTQCENCRKKEAEYYWMVTRSDGQATGLVFCRDCVLSMCLGLVLDLIRDGLLTVGDVVNYLTGRMVAAKIPFPGKYHVKLPVESEVKAAK